MLNSTWFCGCASVCLSLPQKSSISIQSFGEPIWTISSYELNFDLSKKSGVQYHSQEETKIAILPIVRYSFQLWCWISFFLTSSKFGRLLKSIQCQVIVQRSGWTKPHPILEMLSLETRHIRGLHFVRVSHPSARTSISELFRIRTHIT